MYSERLLTLIPEKYHRRIVTHEHFYLKEEFNLMGIHLNAHATRASHMIMPDTSVVPAIP